MNLRKAAESDLFNTYYCRSCRKAISGGNQFCEECEERIRNEASRLDPEDSGIAGQDDDLFRPCRHWFDFVLVGAIIGLLAVRCILFIEITGRLGNGNYVVGFSFMILPLLLSAVGIGIFGLVIYDVITDSIDPSKPALCYVAYAILSQLLRTYNNPLYDTSSAGHIAAVASLVLDIVVLVGLVRRYVFGRR
jgi:hypothetical protein